MEGEIMGVNYDKIRFWNNWYVIKRNYRSFKYKRLDCFVGKLLPPRNDNTLIVSNPNSNIFAPLPLAGLLTAISKGDIANVLKLLTFYASQLSTFTPQIGIYANRIQRILARLKRSVTPSLWENWNEWQFLLREMKRV